MNKSRAFRGRTMPRGILGAAVFAMNRDLHHNINAVRAITPVAIGTTGTGKTGVVVDGQGYGGVEYIIEYGSVTATNAVITPTLTECSTSNGTFTSVADADMISTEALASLGQAATRTSGTSKNTVKRLGYIGNQRYTQLKLISTVTAGPIIGASAILHHPNTAAVAG